VLWYVVVAGTPQLKHLLLLLRGVTQLLLLLLGPATCC
jgi:hypothetical protein